MDCSRLPVNRWYRFWRLSRPERQALLQGLVLLPTTAVALRIVGFRRWQAALSRLAQREETESDFPEVSVQRAQRITKMVQAASRHGLWHTSCLEESLVVWWLLRRRGIPSDLRIGVRKTASALQAHAWVELRGTALNDHEDVHQRFQAFHRDITNLPLEQR